MRPRFVFLWAALLVGISAFGQTRTEFPVVDRSDTTGALQFSGTVTSVEQLVGNELHSSCGVKAQAKNISGRPIVLAIASLDARAPLGGCNTHNVFQMEYFFSGTVPAEATIPLADTSPNESGGEVSGPHNPTQPSEQPRADVRLLFVQYADGSTSGDESAARAILHTRAFLLERLQSLLAAYTSGGDDAFGGALEEKVDNSDAQWQITRLRDLKQSKGTEAALARLRGMLQSAEAHNAARTASNQ